MTPAARREPTNLGKISYAKDACSRADSPERVVETGDDTTVGGVRRLDNVERSSSGEDGHAETKQQTATHELTNGAATRFCGSLNDDTSAGNSTSNHHSISATPSIASGTDEGKSDDTTNLVHGSDNSGPGTCAFDLVVALEGVVGEERVKHRSIETVACRAEEADYRTDVEHNCMPCEELDGLLRFGLCECFGARDDLDFSNGALEVLCNR